MESFPSINKVENNKENKEISFLERFRKSGVWLKGAMAGLTMAGAIESSANSGVDPRAGRDLEKGENMKMSLFLQNPFKSSSFEINEQDKKELEKEVTSFFEQMTKEEAVEFVKNPNIIFQVKSSSDETPFKEGAVIHTEKYGDIKTNESLAEVRGREAGELFMELLSEIDNPNLNDQEDKDFQEALSKKAIEIKTPPRGVTSIEETKKLFPGRNLTNEEALALSRYIGFEIVEKSGTEADKEIAQDLSKYIYYHLLIDKSGSMIDNLKSIFSNIPKDASFANKITLQGFTDKLEDNKVEIEDVSDLTKEVEEMEANIIKQRGQNLEIDEQAMASLMQVLEGIPDRTNVSGKHCLRVITDEYLRNIKIEDLVRIKDMAEKKNVDIKITIYDNTARAFRTVTPGQLEDLIKKDVDFLTEELRFNINNGKFFLEEMPEDSNKDEVLASI